MAKHIGIGIQLTLEYGSRKSENKTNPGAGKRRREQNDEQIASGNARRTRPTA